ncbi:MAG: iron-containing alcohol dehydrogenase [Desulfobacteraceae bacterium]|nr:iron-containing alcohol dehydrogenase [Desulfobacteraceae bacterium]
MNPASIEFLCRCTTGFGKIALEHLPADLTALGAQKPLVITSKAVTKRKGTDHVINAFRESGMTLGVVDSINGASGVDTVRELTTLYQDKGFDAILALGTHRVAHVAKVLNIAVSDTQGNLRTLSGNGQIKKHLNPLIYIPSGTSSGFETAGEAALDALSYSSPFLMPDKVVIDPRLMARDSLEAVAGEALAALACCAEAHGTTANPLIRSYAATAISLVMENIEACLEPFFNPPRQKRFFSKGTNNEKALAGLSAAAAISGYVFSNYDDLTTVNMGRTLGEFSSVNPGVLMGVLLPAVLEYRSGTAGGTMERLLLPLTGLDRYCATPKEQRFEHVLSILRQLINGLFQRSGTAIPRTLADAGISLNTLEQMTTDCPTAILSHAHSGTPMKQGDRHVRT